MGPFDTGNHRSETAPGARLIRILLVGEHAAVRESIAAVLESQSDMHVRECPGAKEVCLAVAEAEPDVIVIKHNAGDGLTNGCISDIGRLGLAKRVLVFTAWLSGLEKRKLIGAGIGGIFLKQRRLGELTAAIRHLARGGTWFDETPPPHAQTDHGRELSERENLAANLVLEGLSNKEIAVQMNVTEGYVKGLLQRVFMKVGVHSRGQLVGVLLSQRMGQDPER